MEAHACVLCTWRLRQENYKVWITSPHTEFQAANSTLKEKKIFFPEDGKCWDGVLLHSQKWYQSLGNPPASVSQVLGLQAGNTTWFPLFGDIGDLIKGIAHARDVYHWATEWYPVVAWVFEKESTSISQASLEFSILLQFCKHCLNPEFASA